jgi:hypothetical protein
MGGRIVSGWHEYLQFDAGFSYRQEKVSPNGTKPEGLWAHAPVSVCDLRFALSHFFSNISWHQQNKLFIFINIVAYPHAEISSTFVFNNILGSVFIFLIPPFFGAGPATVR